MGSRSPPAGVWLFSPATDLLLGCGLLYALIYVALVGSGDAVRAAQPALLVPLLLVFVSLPHYGATLLRVYERRSDRRRYALFAVWASLGVAALFVASVYDAFIGSLFVTLYLTWSPWHYSGQNYGLAVMFLRRGGVALEPGTRRWLHATFVLSYALVFLSFHQQGGPGTLQISAGLGGGSALAFQPIGIPEEVTRAGFVVLTAAYGLSLGACLLGLRAAPARALVPALALVFTQALWFSIPTILRLARVESALAPIGLLDWVALSHAAQYLWVTAFHARASADWRGPAAYFAKVFVAGVALWTVPVLIFSPDYLGPPSSTAAVAMLVASAVNVHHFILDGAIWKLRDGRIAAVLLRTVQDVRVGIPTHSWLRRSVWAGASLWIVLYGLGMLELSVRRAGDPVDLPGLRASLERLRWIGLDDADSHFTLGVDAGSHGDLAGARGEFLRSLALRETARAWVGLAHVELHENHRDAARAALRHAVVAEPDDPETWIRSSEVWMALGDLEPGRAALARAVSLAPDRADLAARLAAVASPARRTRAGTSLSPVRRPP